MATQQQANEALQNSKLQALAALDAIRQKIEQLGNDTKYAWESAELLNYIKTRLNDLTN